ncbi:MAG: hypothetical protein ACXVAX_13700 [Pseudobdellovibrio sp.]
MNKYKNLLCFDLSSYGAALSLLNQFVDGESIIDFEISPCGQQAQLLLLSNELTALQFAQKEALSLLHSQILSSAIISDLHPQLLPIYLSQSKNSPQESLAIFEGSSTANGLKLLQNLLLKGITVLDFRIVRTSPKNVIVVATAEHSKSFDNFETLDFKKSVIEKKQNILNSYF